LKQLDGKDIEKSERIQATQVLGAVRSVRYFSSRYFSHSFILSRIVCFLVVVIWSYFVTLSCVRLMSLCRRQRVYYGWLHFNAVRLFRVDSNTGRYAAWWLLVTLNALSWCVIYVVSADGYVYQSFQLIKTTFVCGKSAPHVYNVLPGKFRFLILSHSSFMIIDTAPRKCVTLGSFRTHQHVSA